MIDLVIRTVLIIATTVLFSTMFGGIARAEDDITRHCTTGGVQKMATCAMMEELKDNMDLQLAYDMLYTKVYNCDTHPAIKAPGTAAGLVQLRKCINDKHLFVNELRALMRKYNYPTMDSEQGRAMYPDNEEALQNYLQNRRQRLGFE